MAVYNVFIKPFVDGVKDIGKGEEALKQLPVVTAKADKLSQELTQTKIDKVRLATENNALVNTNTRIENALIRAEIERKNAATEAQRQAAEDAAKLDKAVKVAVFTGVVSTIYVAKSVYDWARPETPDEKAWREYVKSQAGVREQAARKALDFMKSEREFKPCVVDYAKSARRADGIPMACRESADEYV